MGQRGGLSYEIVWTWTGRAETGLPLRPHFSPCLCSSVITHRSNCSCHCERGGRAENTKISAPCDLAFCPCAESPNSFIPPPALSCSVRRLCRRGSPSRSRIKPAVRIPDGEGDVKKQQGSASVCRESRREEDVPSRSCSSAEPGELLSWR